MLQALRNKIHGWPAIIILGVCVFAISFFGIESYFMSRVDTYVAKVGKHEISQQDFQNRLNQLRQQMAQEQGERFDPASLDKPEMKQRVLDAMIDQQLLSQNADDMGMRVSDQAVRDQIAAIPGLVVDGRFDPAQYRAWLAMQGKTPGQFEAELRKEMSISQVPEAIASTTIISDADIDRYLNVSMQRRSLRYFTVPRPALTDTHVDDAQVEAYYKAHQADFMTPEQVSLKYIEVNAADLKVDDQPTDDDLKKRYEDEKQRFAKPEQRLVSHILVDVPKNATPEQQKDALAKAEKLASDANADNFAKLAEQSSDDLGSKHSGGDLGWLEKGVANAAFDDALFAMQKGQVSKPVLSDEGYHILFLRDVRSGDAKPFAEVRDQLLKEVVTGARDRKFNEVAGKLTDNAYQNPSSLEPAAQALSMPIKNTGLFSRKGGEGLLANPKLLAAAFSDDVLAQGNNSSLIEIVPNSQAIIVHVDKHVPATPRPLAEVSGDVRQKLLDERVAAEAKTKADALLERLRKGEDMTAVASSAGAAVQTVAEATRNQQGIAPALLQQAFLLPHPDAGKSQFATAHEDDGSFALVAVDKVEDADLSKLPPELRTALRQQMSQAYGQLVTLEYIKALRASTDIKIAQDRM